MIESYIGPLAGGILIGLATSLFLLFEGRVFGVSGILAGALLPKAGEKAWRIAAVLGLVATGLLLRFTMPDLLMKPGVGPLSKYIIGGLLVGFGTQLGSGCTSGHGVCGVSRLSPRSIVATLTFIAVGMIVVAVIRQLGVSL